MTVAVFVYKTPSRLVDSYLLLWERTACNLYCEDEDSMFLWNAHSYQTTWASIPEDCYLCVMIS